MFLTESQKHYYTAMKKLGRKKPQKVIKRPQNPYHALFYDISLSRRFEIAIFVLIFLNMVSMGIEHYDQSRAVTFSLEICNALFTTIFSLGKIQQQGWKHNWENGIQGNCEEVNKTCLIQGSPTKLSVEGIWALPIRGGGRVWANFFGKNLLDLGGGLDPCPDGLGHFLHQF